MNSKKLLFLIVLFVACLAAFASDIYTPAIPAIAKQLSTSTDMLQWSMSAYMFGLAFSLLFYGAVSEGVGRKLPLLFGIGLMLVSSIFCIFVKNIDALIVGRVLQGVGAGACSGLWRAVFRDVFSGEQLAKLGSYFGLGVAFVMPIAPVVGGLLQQTFCWQAVFVFIAFYALAIGMMVLFFYKETSTHHCLANLKLSNIASGYCSLLKSRVFVGSAVAVFLCYGGLFAWFVVGPVLLIKEVGLSPAGFGLSFTVGAIIACFFGSMINGRYVEKIGIVPMMRIGWSLMLASAIVMLVLYFVVGVNFWAIVVPAFVFYFGGTFIWPGATALALSPFGKNAGHAGALYSFIQQAGGAVFAGIVALLPDTTQISLGLIFLVCVAAAWILFELMVKPAL